MKTVHLLVPVAAVLVAGLLPGRSEAKTLDEISEEVAALAVEASGLSQSYLKEEEAADVVSVEKKVTDGELYYRLGDYQRSAVIFLGIVDDHASHPAYPNALFMLAESLFNAKDYYGARSRYIEVLENSTVPSFQQYQEMSLARLLEISMHLEDFEGVEKYFSSLAITGDSGASSVINYVKGKYYYFKDDLVTSLSYFQKVPQDDDYYARSRFFMGVIYSVQQDYQSAAGIFEEIAGLEAATPEARRVRDLAKLNLGRLYYETDQLERSAEIYESIPKTSDLFDVALYEVAWVYIKMEDPTKAERSLEVLSISNPNSTLIPDAKILRGNLLLRNGEFDAALKVFKDINKEFGPVKQELDDMFLDHDDPEQFFVDLVAENMSVFDASIYLPPIALKWIETSSVTDRGVEMLQDLAVIESVLADNELVIDKMNLVLEGETKVNAFPLLKSGRSRATQIENRLTQLTQELLDIEASLLPSSAQSEYASLQQEKQELEAMLGDLPTSPEDAEAREAKAKENYKELSKVLVIQERKVDQLQAKIVATELYLEGVVKAKTGVLPPDMAAVQTELETQKLAVEQYREEIDDIKNLIEMGKAKVGVGDTSDKTDELVRLQYEQVVKKQHALLDKYGVSGSTVQKLDSVYAQIDGVRQELAKFNAQVESLALKKTQDLKSELDKEQAKLDGYEERLDVLDGEAKEVMGHIAMYNFLEVREKFGDLILKADVGIIDVAWSRKEEHRHRVQYLTSERLDELQLLDDEFSAILKEAETEASEGTGDDWIE